MSKIYDLSGIPGFYQEADFKWTFSAGKGIFIPIFDESHKIQALSIHLDKPFNNTKGFKYLCDAIFICIKDENA